MQDLLCSRLGHGETDLVRRAVRANIASVQQLRHGSVIIEGLIASHGLMVAGAEYSLETGVVEFREETLV